MHLAGRARLSHRVLAIEHQRDARAASQLGRAASEPAIGEQQARRAIGEDRGRNGIGEAPGEGDENRGDRFGPT